ncbi:GFA family protein [Sneathiella litorea]|uniref:GFA family protein n=1 Tax=Sneathiella litorea TaxID=2606216 RepID=A0A6L8W6R0_9PROT|nr:GFA family protein [Sneathiella litorea]MZR30164.1 GFA family protein [Sneathiella litorea]
MVGKERTGTCLCGDVKINAKKTDDTAGVCHCSSCRRWGGGPLLTTDCGTEVSFDGDENIKVFNSSEWAERGFCMNCGTHLFYRLKENGQYVVPLGLFGDDDFVLDHQIFIDEKPAFYTFANKTTMMTGEEVFAKFAPPE